MLSERFSGSFSSAKSLQNRKIKVPANTQFPKSQNLSTANKAALSQVSKVALLRQARNIPDCALFFPFPVKAQLHHVKI